MRSDTKQCLLFEVVCYGRRWYRCLYDGIGVMFRWSFRVRLLFVDSRTSVRPVRNGHAIQAVMETVVRSGRDRHKCTLLSVRSTGASAPASRGGITDRPIKRAGWWRPTQRKCMTAAVSDNIRNGEVEWRGNSEEPGWYHFQKRDG